MNLLRLNALIFLLSLIAACATDAYVTQGADAGTSQDQDRRDTSSSPDSSSEAGAHLELVLEAYYRLQVGESGELPVLFVDENNVPISGERLRFDFDSSAAVDTTLSAATSTTGEDGIGSIRVHAGVARAEFDVTVSVSGQDMITPVVYHVVVAPKDVADYLVRVNYDGPLVGLDVDVLLYTAGSRSCDELVADIANPSPDMAYLSEMIRQNAADDSFPARRISMHPGDFPIYYAVAFATKEDMTVGYACTDGLPVEVELGDEVVIEMQLNNLWPEVEGSYELDNLFDLIEGIPDAYEPYIRFIGEFFQSPGGAIVDILSENWDDFADLPSWAREAAGEFINTLIEEYLPPEAQTIFQVGGDLYTTLSKFNADGTMIITENAADDGSLALDNSITLTTFEFTFDETHYRRDLRDYGYSAAEGVWTGHLGFQPDQFGYAINIDTFGLMLNYGEILLFVLESVIFPEFIDPSITSFEDFVTWLIDCHDLAIGTADSGTIQNIVESVCDSALEYLADYLRDLIVSQSSDISSYFELSTENCAITDLDHPGDFRIDNIGSYSQPCSWDGTIRIDDDSSETNNMNATFNATR